MRLVLEILHLIMLCFYWTYIYVLMFGNVFFLSSLVTLLSPFPPYTHVSISTNVFISIGFNNEFILYMSQPRSLSFDVGQFICMEAAHWTFQFVVEYRNVKKHLSTGNLEENEILTGMHSLDTKYKKNNFSQLCTLISRFPGSLLFPVSVKNNLNGFDLYTNRQII